MKREELKALGLTDEQINEVMRVNGTDIEAVKTKATDLETQMKALNDSIKERDTQLESLKATSGDAESLKSQIAALQETNTKQAQEAAAKLKEIQVNSAIKLALTGKVHDSDIVASLVAKDKLLVNDDGSILGLDDQIKALQESKKFLFTTEDTGNQGGAGFKVGNPGAGDTGADGVNAALAAAFGNTATK